MRHFSSYFLPLLAIVLFAPNVSAASTTNIVGVTTTYTPITAAQELSAELSQLSAQLAVSNSTLAAFSLAPGQSIQQSSASSTTGVLNVSFPNFEHLAAVDGSPAMQLAKIALQYMPCLGAAPSVCVSTSSPTYPAVNADLVPGQSTKYLHYNVSLTSFATSSVGLQITDSALLDSIQTQVDAIALKVKALLQK